MPDERAERPQDGRVAQVPLPAGDRQLGGEVRGQGVGDPEIPLGVLEVDRIDLVRHRARADLFLGNALTEIPEGNISPNVAAEADRYRIEMLDRAHRLD